MPFLLQTTSSRLTLAGPGPPRPSPRMAKQLLCCLFDSGPKPPDIRNTWDIGEVIGAGSFGQVRVCTLKEDESVVRAVKIVELDDSSGTPLVVRMQLVMAEVKIMMQLRHESIIRMYEFFEDADFIYMVMDKCSGGEIFDKLLELKRFTEEHASTLCKSMLGAVEYKGFFSINTRSASGECSCTFVRHRPPMKMSS